MRLADLITDVETIAALGTTRRPTIRRALQQGLFEYAASYDWPHYRDLGTITTLASVTAGTVSVTAGSAAVTGVGTAFTAAMVGRKFRVGSEPGFYYIETFVSATSITLRDVYQGSTQSGVSYTIFQDEYKLDANAHKLLDIRQIQDRWMMLGLPYLDMDRWFADPNVLANPTYFSIVGRRDDRYVTGTVTIAANSRSLTGASTVWTSVPGLTRGTRIEVESNSEVYTVNTVDSDTAITVYELSSAAASASAYRAKLNNLLVKVQPVPDAQRNLYYRKQRIPYPLINDFDEPDLPREYHYGLTWFGVMVGFGLLGKLTEAQAAEARWQRWIELQKHELGIDMPAIDYPRRSMDEFPGMTRGTFRLSPNQSYPLWLGN